MFPTCSKRFFAGRNALSAVDLTISHPGDGREPMPSVVKSISSMGRRLNPQPCAPGRATLVVCSPRLGGETYNTPAARRGHSHADRGSRMPARRRRRWPPAAATRKAQDENEPAGEFPVEVTEAKFPARQRLAETSDLVLEVENAGDESIPDLAITLYTGDEKSDGPFNLRSEQEGLADPNRPVWILEDDYPKVLDRRPRPRRSSTPSRPPAPRRRRPTPIAFGAVAPGDSVGAVWRVTPVVRRHVHRQLRGRRRARRQGQGGHRRRQPGRGRVRGDDLDQAPEHARHRLRRSRSRALAAP